MGQKKRKGQKQSSHWLPPKGAGEFFYRSSDDAFKSAHPVGYVFLVLLGLAALLLPCVLYCIYAFSVSPDGSGWMVLGWIGGFIIGVGLFNFVAIIIDQYLGLWVSILSFLIGGIMVAISLHFL